MSGSLAATRFPTSTEACGFAVEGPGTAELTVNADGTPFFKRTDPCP